MTSSHAWTELANVLTSVGSTRKFQDHLKSLPDAAGLSAQLRGLFQGALDGTVSDCKALGLDDLAPADRVRLLTPAFCGLDEPVTLAVNPQTEAFPLPDRTLEPYYRLLGELNASVIPRSAPQFFQHDILSAAGFKLQVTDTITATCAGSFVILQSGVQRPIFFYYFLAPEPFFLITTHGATPKSMFFPKQNLQFNIPTVKYSTWETSELKAVIVELARDMQPYVKTADKKLSLFCNAQAHIGDQTFGETEAYSRWGDAGLLGGPEYLLMGRARYFNYFDLFPELGKKQVINFSNSSLELNEAIVGKKLMVVHPSLEPHWISRRLSDRFKTLPPSLDSHEHQADLDAVIASGKPVVWFEIRSNDRMWAEQIEGISSLINSLARRYSGVSAIIAGWSVLDGKTELTAGDAECIAKDKDVAQQIQRLCLPGAKVVAVVGMTAHDKAIWAQVAHTHVCVFSSGLIFPVGIARKQGIILYSDGYKPSPKIKVFEDPPRLKLITDGLRKVEGTVRAMTGATFHIPWQTIFSQLKRILAEETGAKPEAPKQVEEVTTA